MPDNVVFSRQWVGFHWDRQQYSFNAVCTTVCLGFLTLRWHKR